MKLSVAIITALLCAVTRTEAKKMKRIRRPCQTPENCAVKCSDGAYHMSKPKKKSETPELRCNDTHHDFRWGGMVCTQTVGPSSTETRHQCHWINGTICSKDERAWVDALCIAEMTYLPEFELACSHGIKRWSAWIDYPDIKNECTPDRHRPSAMSTQGPIRKDGRDW